jgi:hypothetical protein
VRLLRTSDMLFVCAVIAAAAFTYKAKHDAEGQLAELRRVQAAIKLERETIDVLKADWSLFTQPARLQRLAETYADDLGLRPLDPSQIGTVAELPPRPLDIELLIEEGVDVTAAMPDTGTTASVRP